MHAGGCQECGRGMGRNSLVGKGLYFGVMEMFGTRQRRWLHSIVNALNVSELFILKRLIFM